MSIRISPAELTATRDKIAKINARAAKRGFTGRFTIAAERIEDTQNVMGFILTEVFYEVTIDGDSPSYEGWTFLARVDLLGDSFTLATAPGVDHVARDQVRPSECDHCGINRQRKHTYLVQSATGEIKNVGSTCLKDFLGWDGNVVFISTEEIEESIGGGYASDPATYDVDSVLAVAFGAIRTFGFRRSGEDGSTAGVVRSVLGWNHLTDKDRARLEPVREYADEANAKVATIKAWILSDEFSGQSTYVDNLKVAVAADSVGDQQIGLLASAPQAYVRHLETADERAAKEAQWAEDKAARTSGVHFGTKGEKVTINATIVSIRYTHHAYGTTVIYRLRTEDGNVATWFASREALGEKEGVAVTITGTVKEHDEYEGAKETILTRCKVTQ